MSKKLFNGLNNAFFAVIFSSKKTNESHEPGVSPVIGVMLLITVTLILAAIISGMTGGIAQKQEKPPQLLFEASVVKDLSNAGNSFFDVRIVSVSQGIPTRDLKLITEWRGSGSSNRTVITPLSKNVDDTYTYPLGYNPGESGPSSFGNFTLLAGTRLNANSTIKDDDDDKYLNAVLSENWKSIQDGTPIKIQFIHVPSGAIIAEKEITAEV